MGLVAGVSVPARFKQVPVMVEFTENTDRSPLGSRTLEQLSADDADLRAAIGDLAGLVADHRRLPELLAEVATFAVHAIPGADGAGVTLLNVDRVDNMVAALAASAPFVTEIDEIQYVTLNEGPCITAALERRTVRSGSLGGEKMWPRFGPRVGRLGVHSAMSLPLLLPDRVVGAINVYAYGKDAFDEHAAEFGELFAKPAAVAVHNAQILADALALTVQLQTALSTRPVIDQAIGLIRGRTGRSAEDALTQLRAMSQAEHRRLAEVAQNMLDEAVRRVRARARTEADSPAGVSEQGRKQSRDGS
jgi:GAF domain-containing protein/ANTAR domain-containing protein